MQIENAEIIAVKSAKEPGCIQVVLVTNEVTGATAGALFDLKNKVVKLTVQEVPQTDTF
jgi:hypothetical protein